MDKIHIKNLEVFGYHGVLPEENSLGQKFLISVTLHVDTRNAGVSDDLSKTVNYGKVCQFITRFLNEQTFSLIEAAAEHLSMELLSRFDNVRRVELEISKPWAPIGLPLDAVSVEIDRGWHRAYVALGSNLGDSMGYIQNGLKGLREITRTRLLKQSTIIPTKAYGVTEQPDFLNAVVLLETLLSPMELLRELNRIEDENGRTRQIKWGPRTLDLDIVFYDDLVINEEGLVIPHPDMKNRDFVLKPLAELDPYYLHPVLGKTIKQLLERVNLSVVQ